MKFIEACPETWKELQDFVALLLNQAGYKATSPCTIETVRGKVEVDVLVESPDPLVKMIICECKFWTSSVPKEKVHAFRTVVNDSGASMGFLISLNGFQSGAIEAAALSNVKLITWSEFLELICDKWIVEKLKCIKKKSDPIAEYVNELHFPYEQLKEEDKPRYNAACRKYGPLRLTCWLLTKSVLKNDSHILRGCYSIDEFSSIVEYLNYLDHEIDKAIPVFKEITDSSGIMIPEERFHKSETFSLSNLE